VLAVVLVALMAGLPAPIVPWTVMRRTVRRHAPGAGKKWVDLVPQTWWQCAACTLGKAVFHRCPCAFPAPLRRCGVQAHLCEPGGLRPLWPVRTSN